MVERDIREVLQERGINPEYYRMLVDHGRRTGSLSRSDVLDLLPDVEFDEPIIQQVVGAVSGEGISLAEIAETAEVGEVFNADAVDEDDLGEMAEEDLADINLAGIDVDDVLRIYLREATQTPLLTAAEEVELARRIERCRLAFEELSRGTVEPKRREMLERFITEGQQARERMIRANARLVVSVAKRYVGRGLPLSDLIQEGNIGLMRAIRHYEYQRGFKFSTYATWWIRQAVSRALADQSRTIRLPAYMSDQVGRMRRVQLDLQQRLGRLPTNEEIGEAMGMTATKIEQMIGSLSQPMSLETPVGEEDDAELGDMLEDVNTPNPEEMVMDSMMGEEIRAKLLDLPSREREVLTLRYGLGEEEAMTLAEVGSRMGITRERARQLELQAIERLRNPTARRRRRAST